MSTDGDGESHCVYRRDSSQALESDDSSNVINFTRDNMEDMMNTRYHEFDKALQIPCLVDIYSTDKKTIKNESGRVSEGLHKITLMWLSAHLWIGHWKGVVSESVNADGILFPREQCYRMEKLHVFMRTRRVHER